MTIGRWWGAPATRYALRVPGSELKEGFLPQEMVNLSVQFNDRWSGQLLAITDWNPTIPEASGSYFSANDFAAAFEQVAREGLDAATLARTLLTDGPLEPAQFDTATVRTLDAQVWGQAFEPPVFCDEVEVVSQRLVGERHMKLSVRHAGALRDAIWFGHSEPLEARVRLAYRLSLDEYNGRERVQMVVEGSEPAA